MKQHKNPVLTILVPFDFTPLSMNALRVAIAMSLKHNSILHVVHAVEIDYGVFPEPYSDFYVGTHPFFDSIKTGKKHLEKLKQNIFNQFNTNLITHTKHGNPSDVICAIAAEIKADLIVMGSHGASGFREFFIGSNAYRVIKNATFPVLTIPGSFTKDTFENILFPVRNVRGVEEKYETIRPILFMNHSQLEVVGLTEEKHPGDHEHVNVLLDSLKKRFVKDKIPFLSVEYECKNIAEKVLELSHKRNPDLLVINATLDKNWKELFIGSYTQQIVNHAKVPVLSFKEEFLHSDKEQSKILLAEWAKKYELTNPMVSTFW